MEKPVNCRQVFQGYFCMLQMFLRKRKEKLKQVLWAIRFSENFKAMNKKGNFK